MLLIIVGSKLLLTTSPPQNIEHKHVINNSIDQYFEDNEVLDSYFSYFFSKNIPSKRWLLLFISEASNCSNCLNEVNDYVELSNKISPLMNNYHSLLIYHGEDSLKSTRFAKASNISSIVDKTSFMYTSDLLKLKISKIKTNYSVDSYLFLIDLKNNKIFHAFYLPKGITTKFSNKEIAFRNAMINYTHN